MSTTSSVANDKDEISLSRIEERLGKAIHRPHRFSPNIRQAAVAVVVRELEESLDILFIKRAIVHDDPWSGQMAFPGGHLDQEDSSLAMAAVRETLEETGVRISMEQCLGELPTQSPASQRRKRTMVVVPYVFGIKSDPKIRINHEVDSIVWGRVESMLNGSLHSTETFHFNGRASVFDGYRLGTDKFVWGLTYRTLQTFFSIIDPSYREPSGGVS